MASRWPRKHSVPFLYTMFVGVMLTHLFTDAIIPPITRGGSPRRCCNGGGPPLKDNAVLTEPRILTLRGGGATSGIWETFNRMQADVKHKLDQIKVSKISVHKHVPNCFLTPSQTLPPLLNIRKLSHKNSTARQYCNTAATKAQNLP